MKTQTTTARQAQQEEDLFLKGFYGALSLIVKLLRYIGRRTIQHPLVGLLYLVVAFPAAFLIVQDLRIWWATATAPRFTQPASIWPLSEPLQPLGVALLAAVIVSVWVIDRRVAHRATALAARDKSIQAPVKIDEWVLGRSYERTWNPDPGEFELRETREFYRLTEEHLRTNLLVIAPQGSGKTHSVLQPALYLFKRIGAAALYIDAKGDGFDPKDFHLNFNIKDPRNSMRLNVWSGDDPQIAAERLAEALVPDLGIDKKYFTDNAKEALTDLVIPYHLVYGEMPSLKQLLSYLRNPDTREDLAEELRKWGLSDNSQEMEGIRHINQLAAQKNDALGSLNNALAPLARGDMADLLTTGRNGYSIEQLLRGAVRVRFALSAGERPALATIIGRLVLAQFTYAVISPDCNKSILKAAVVDEAGRFVTPAIATGMSMARENRGGFLLAVQDLSQIEDPALREDVLSVAGNKLVMAGAGDLDAKKFTALFGSEERPYTTHTESTSHGSHSSHSRGQGQGSGDFLAPTGSTGSGTRQQSTRGRSSSHQQGEGSSRQLKERSNFLTGEIRSLPQFHVLIERRDSRGQVTPATVVNLDIELIRNTCTAQALQLYSRTGRLEAVSPQLPRIKGAHVPAHKGILPLLADRDQSGVLRAAELSCQADPEVEKMPAPSEPDTEAWADMPMEVPSTPGEGQPESRTTDTGTTQPPEWVHTAADLIVQRLRMRQGEAQDLACLACRNGRDVGYILDNIEHATATGNVKSPTGLFRFLIKNNYHRHASAEVKHKSDTAPKPQGTRGEAGT